MIGSLRLAFATALSAFATCLGLLLMWLMSHPVYWDAIVGCFVAGIFPAYLAGEPPLIVQTLALRLKLRKETRRLERWNNLGGIAGALDYAAWVVTDSNSSDEARERLLTEAKLVKEKQRELSR